MAERLMEMYRKWCCARSISQARKTADRIHLKDLAGRSALGVIGTSEEVMLHERRKGMTPETESSAVRTECERRLIDSRSFEVAARLAWILCPELELLREKISDEVKLGLTIAAVVSYARPFTAQADRTGRPHGERGFNFPTLYQDELASLDQRFEGENYRQYHERMMRLRHKFFAHGDASAAEIDLPEDPRIATMKQATALSDEDAKRLRLLADTLKGVATDRYIELRDELVKGLKASL